MFELRQMKRKGRPWHFQFLADQADGHSGRSRDDKRSKDREAAFMSQSAERADSR